MSKVKLDILKPWITRRITELMGIEDDVVIGLVFNYLENEKVSILSSLFVFAHSIFIFLA
jgi:hypothetical protein